MSTLSTIRIIAADHPVKSVVVLKSSKAEIVRRFDVALQVRDTSVAVGCSLLTFTLGRSEQVGHIKTPKHD